MFQRKINHETTIEHKARMLQSDLNAMSSNFYYLSRNELFNKHIKLACNVVGVGMFLVNHSQ